MSEPEQTALIVAVPEAEVAVGRHRAALDRVASWGVPAHLTILFPFRPPAPVSSPAAGTVAAKATTAGSRPATVTTAGAAGRR